MSHRPPIFAPLRHVTSALSLAISLLVTASVAARQNEDYSDGNLFAAWVTAEQLAAARDLDGAMQAWDAYAALINKYRADERPYGQIYDVRRFQINQHKAQLLEQMTDTLAPPGDSDESVAKGLAHLQHIARYLGAYVGQFNNRAAVPWLITDHDRYVALYGLGKNLRNQGEAHAKLGAVSSARKSWEAARTLLADAVEHLTGEPFLAKRPRPANDSTGMITNLADEYLRTVAKTGNAGEYLEHAEAGLQWLPREEGAVIEQVGRQAATWHGAGTNVVEASKLLELVRTAGPKWFEAGGTDRSYLVWAHLLEVQMALETGAKDKAVALLDKLFEINGLSETEKEQAEALKRLYEPGVRPRPKSGDDASARPEATDRPGASADGGPGRRGFPASIGDARPETGNRPPARQAPSSGVTAAPPERRPDLSLPLLTGAVVLVATLLAVALMRRRGLI